MQMNDNPYESPAETGGAPRPARISWAVLDALWSALLINIPAMLWAALNFLNADRYMYVIIITFTGAVIGAKLSMRRSHTEPVPIQRWFWLIVTMLTWLLFHPG